MRTGLWWRGLLVLSIVAAAACASAGAGAGSGAAKPLQVQDQKPSVWVRCGDAPVLEYRYGDVSFKPYVRQFLSPGGVNVLRDQVPDHLHHHAMMLAIGVEGVDFWSETQECGRELHRSLADVATVEAAGGPARATFTEALDWAGPGDQKPLVRERRTIEVLSGEGLAASLLTWRSRVETGEGRAAVKLWGRHYFGLGMRFPASMDNVAEFFTAKGKADGQVVRGDERLTPGPWMACTGEVDGKPVTIAMFDHPDNPRPALWFTMGKPFGYVSATLNLEREPMTLRTGEGLTLTYGVAVWDGRVGADMIGGLHKRWLQLEAAPAQGR